MFVSFLFKLETFIFCDKNVIANGFVEWICYIVSVTMKMLFICIGLTSTKLPQNLEK